MQTEFIMPASQYREDGSLPRTAVTIKHRLTRNVVGSFRFSLNVERASCHGYLLNGIHLKEMNGKRKYFVSADTCDGLFKHSQSSYTHLRFEVFTATAMKNTIF
jgi:hypothetical protein